LILWRLDSFDFGFLARQPGSFLRFFFGNRFTSPIRLLDLIFCRVLLGLFLLDFHCELRLRFTQQFFFCQAFSGFVLAAQSERLFFELHRFTRLFCCQP
jgi:hypothetical protein